MGLKIIANNGYFGLLGWYELVEVLNGGVLKLYVGTVNHAWSLAALDRVGLKAERAEQIRNNPNDMLYTKYNFQLVIYQTEAFLDSTRVYLQNNEEAVRNEIAQTPSDQVIKVFNARIGWCNLAIQMLRNMSAHTQSVHRKGWIGTIRKITSFIQNLYLKWKGIITFQDFTLPKIKWPKDNCSYALKVADEYEKIRKAFEKQILTKELVTRLESDLKEIIGPDISIQAYRNWAIDNHPDKHSNSEEATERFRWVENVHTTLKQFREILELRPPEPLQSTSNTVTVTLDTDGVD